MPHGRMLRARRTPPPKSSWPCQTPQAGGWSFEHERSIEEWLGSGRAGSQRSQLAGRDDRSAKPAPRHQHRKTNSKNKVTQNTNLKLYSFRTALIFWVNLSKMTSSEKFSKTYFFAFPPILRAKTVSFLRMFIFSKISSGLLWGKNILKDCCQK